MDSTTKPWTFYTIGGVFTAAAIGFGALTALRIAPEISEKAYTTRIDNLKRGRGHEAEDVRMDCDREGRFGLNAEWPVKYDGLRRIGFNPADCVTSKTNTKIQAIEDESKQNVLVRAWKHSNPQDYTALSMALVGFAFLGVGRKVAEIHREDAGKQYGMVPYRPNDFEK